MKYGVDDVEKFGLIGDGQALGAFVIFISRWFKRADFQALPVSSAPPIHLAGRLAQLSLVGDVSAAHPDLAGRDVSAALAGRDVSAAHPDR